MAHMLLDRDELPLLEDDPLLLLDDDYAFVGWVFEQARTTWLDRKVIPLWLKGANTKTTDMFVLWTLERLGTHLVMPESGKSTFIREEFRFLTACSWMHKDFARCIKYNYHPLSLRSNASACSRALGWFTAGSHLGEKAVRTVSSFAVYMMSPEMVRSMTSSPSYVLPSLPT